MFSSRLSGFGGTPFPFEPIISAFKEVKTPDEMDTNKGFLVLWGGADISPSLYNEKACKLTWADNEPSERDLAEKALYERAKEMALPIVAICRGAQLACALEGGKLIQHVNKHGNSHMMTTKDGRKLVTSSVHHQMLYPWDLDMDLIAWAEGHSDVYIGENCEDVEMPKEAYDDKGKVKEPEVVWFPKAKCLAFQGHPEFCQASSPYVAYANDLIKAHCG